MRVSSSREESPTQAVERRKEGKQYHYQQFHDRGQGNNERDGNTD